MKYSCASVPVSWTAANPKYACTSGAEQWTTARARQDPGELLFGGLPIHSSLRHFKISCANKPSGAGCAQLGPPRPVGCSTWERGQTTDGRGAAARGHPRWCCNADAAGATAPTESEWHFQWATAKTSIGVARILLSASRILARRVVAMPSHLPGSSIGPMGRPVASLPALSIWTSPGSRHRSRLGIRVGSARACRASNKRRLNTVRRRSEIR
jgi:hypothetical protein